MTAPAMTPAEDLARCLALLALGALIGLAGERLAEVWR